VHGAFTGFAKASGQRRATIAGLPWTSEFFLGSQAARKARGSTNSFGEESGGSILDQ